MIHTHSFGKQVGNFELVTAHDLVQLVISHLAGSVSGPRASDSEGT